MVNVLRDKLNSDTCIKIICICPIVAKYISLILTVNLRRVGLVCTCCHSVLEMLMLALCFLQNLVSLLKVPDYYIVVKRGMCFDLIAYKLRNNIYEDLPDFVSDMRLVFDNCRLYYKVV